MTIATDDRTATISQLINVPARFLFLAHSRPEYLKRWYGPRNFPVTTCEVDFRVGGKWRMAMTGPDGVQGPFFGGTFHEIIPDARIVYDTRFEEPHGGALNIRNEGTIHVTTTLVETDGATTMTVATRFSTAAMKSEYLGMGMLDGQAEGLDQLSDLAAELARQC